MWLIKVSILLIAALCFLSTGKVTLQTAFSKKNIKNLPDATLFIGIVFIFASLIFGNNLVGASPLTFICGAVFGFFTVLFQLSYTRALAIGSTSLTVMLINFGMIIPIVFSFFAYDERISRFGIVGIILTFVSFILLYDFTGKRCFDKSWLLLTLCTLLSNSVLSITQKIYAHTAQANEGKAFVAVSYAVAALLTLLFFAFLKAKHFESTCKPGPVMILSALGVGVTLAVFQAVNTYALKVVPTSILLPSTSGGCIILSAVVGVLLFRDKLSPKQLLSIACGALAIVMMNL